MQPVTAKPLYIRMHADDNVAIVANRGGLHPGAEFACGLRLVEQIPQGHKVALTNIAEDEVIRRYGEVIGRAAAPIARGSWVKESLVQMPDAPSFDNLPRPNGGAIRLPPLEGYTFEGYRNADGSVGTRNILAISTSVQCVAGTVEFALDRIRKELLPRYPNVDDVVAITHAYGCGVAINAPGAAVPIRTLQNLARNPNFGGEVMIVGLGCEKLQPELLLPEGMNADDEIMRMQDEGLTGFGEIVEDIVQMADARLKILNQRQRETCPASAGGRHAMRRQRCVLGRDRQSGAGLRRGSSGARWRHRDVLRSHRSARRHPSPDAARDEPGCCGRAGARDGLV